MNTIFRNSGLFLFLLLSGMMVFYSSCEKEIEPKGLESIFNNVTAFEFSQEHDAITFHTGYALQSVLANYPTLKRTFLEAYANGIDRSISEICNTSPDFKEKLNDEIRESLIKNEPYSNWKNNELNKNLTTVNFDFISFFDAIISKDKTNQGLVYYTPEGLGRKTDPSKILIGVDVTLPNEEDALVFDHNSSEIFSQVDAENVLNLVIFVGINDLVSNVEMRGSTFQPLEKWYHYGKVERQDCTQNCDIDYEFHTKYRWYSGWNLKASGTLTQNGQSAEYYYSEYRIGIQVVWDGLSNFSLWEKHWANDAWSPVNY